MWTLLPATAVVRAYARANRRAAGNVLERPVPHPYRSTAGQPFVARLRTVLTDPASWRDLAVLFVHWYATAVPLTRAQAALTGSLLR